MSSCHLRSLLLNTLSEFLKVTDDKLSFSRNCLLWACYYCRCTLQCLSICQLLWIEIIWSHYSLIADRLLTISVKTSRISILLSHSMFDVRRCNLCLVSFDCQQIRVYLTCTKFEFALSLLILACYRCHQLPGSLGSLTRRRHWWIHRWLNYRRYPRSLHRARHSIQAWMQCWWTVRVRQWTVEERHVDRRRRVERDHRMVVDVIVGLSLATTLTCSSTCTPRSGGALLLRINHCLVPVGPCRWAWCCRYVMLAWHCDCGCCPLIHH